MVCFSFPIMLTKFEFTEVSCTRLKRKVSDKGAMMLIVAKLLSYASHVLYINFTAVG